MTATWQEPRPYLITFTGTDRRLLYAELVESDLLGALNHAKAVMPEQAAYCQVEPPDDEDLEALGVPVAGSVVPPKKGEHP